MYYLKRKPKRASEPRERARERSKPDLVKKLDRIFSLYIRLRDVMPNGYAVCISCGKPKHFSELDCGHYFSRKHMATRFDERNANAECAGCNRFSADHLDGYRDRLVRKIGLNEFESLRLKAHSTKQWYDYELEALIKHYTAEVRRLSADKGIRVRI